MKYKLGQGIFIKAEISDIDNISKEYFVIPNPHNINWVSEDKIIPMDKTYSDGLNDAWKLADKVYEMRNQQRYDVFGTESLAKVMDLSPQEALAKIEAYEKEKSVCVGDVVIIDDDVNALVIDEISEESVFVLTENGCIETRTKKHLEKTEKKIPISGLLRQIGE